jgi:hypothetical protein
VFPRQIQRIFQRRQYNSCVGCERHLSTADKLRDKSILARNATFCLQDVSPDHRQRVFC